MALLSKPGYRLLLLLAWSAAPVPAALAQNAFAVIQVANATDDVTIQYQFQWGDDKQQYTVKPRSRAYHYDRKDPENQNSSPIPQIEFVPGTG